MMRGLLWFLPLALGLLASAHGATRANIPALIETLTNGTETVARIEAAKQLGQSGSPQALEPLVKALDDANRPVRWASIEALGELQNTHAVPALLKYLERTEAYRWGNILTVNALAALDDRRAAKPLLALLEHTTDPILQRVIVLALGQLDDSDAIPAILPFLKDDRRWLSRAAQLALVQLTLKQFQGRAPRGYEAWAKWYNNAGNRHTVPKRK